MMRSIRYFSAISALTPAEFGGGQEIGQREHRLGPQAPGSGVGGDGHSRVPADAFDLAGVGAGPDQQAPGFLDEPHPVW